MIIYLSMIRTQIGIRKTKESEPRRYIYEYQSLCDENWIEERLIGASPKECYANDAMGSEEVIKSIQDICNSLIAVSKQQRDQYQQEQFSTEPRERQSLQSPIDLANSRIMIQPKTLQYMLLNGFWGAYQVIVDDLDSAAIAFAIRPLTEISFRHLLYFGLEEDEDKRKEMALKYYLLTLADMPEYAVQTEFIETFKTLIQDIPNEEERAKFQGLLDRGFKEEEIGVRMSKIFPGFNNQGLINKIKPYLVGIGTAELDERTPAILMHRFSGYVHANAIMMHAMQKQDADKSYLFSHSAILFTLGYRIAEFTNDHLLETGFPIDHIYQEMLTAHQKIVVYQSKNFPPQS